MKNTLLASAMVLASSPVFAVQFGTDVNWSEQQFDNQVYMNCTGTVIGSGFILTADHCPTVSSVHLNNGNVAEITNRYAPFELVQGDDRYIDISLWSTKDKLDVQAFTPLSPETVNQGDLVKMYGFGRYEPVSEPILGYAIREVIDLGYESENYFFTKDIGQGRSIEGDSGGQTLFNGSLVGITTNGTLGDDIVNHVKLSNPIVKDWILNTVNDWHSPTVLNTKGKAVLPIQSLHNHNVGDLLNQLSVSGDAQVQLDSISCESMDKRYDDKGLLIEATAQDVRPYDVCKLVVESTGYEGFVTLGDYTVTVNPNIHPEPVKPEPEVTPPTEGGKSGGSLGFLGLIGLGLVSFKRMKK